MTTDQNKQPDEKHEIADTVETPESFLASLKQKVKNSGNSVLVVDDELAIRRLVSRSIRKSCPDVNIVEALNGKEALEKLSELREKTRRDPVFIVTDLNMPVMDGWEFINELEKDYRSKGKSQGIPVIVLSSTSGEKGFLFTRRSVHGGKCNYSPLITIAKESCIDATKYDATGEKGLISWIGYFLQYAQ